MNVRRTASFASLLSALLLVGCPAEPTPPPPTATSARRPAARRRPAATTPIATERAGASAVTSDAPREPNREQLLAMTPEAAVASGLRGDAPGGTSAPLAGEGAIAMAEQLRAADVPPEAVDLCVVAFDRARERTTGTITDAARGELERAVKLQAGELPALHPWVAVLADRAFVRADLEAVVVFLMKVRELRALAQALARPR